MGNLNKETMANEISEEHGLTKVKSRKIVDQIFEKMENAMVNGDKVLIYGFGKFESKERSARRGYNPSKKEKMNIEATKAPSFKPAKGLKRAIKAGK